MTQTRRFFRLVRIVIPFAISVALFAYLFSRIDAIAVGDAMTTTIALRWALPLVIFNVVTFLFLRLLQRTGSQHRFHLLRAFSRLR